jgi:hypothetical protein
MANLSEYSVHEYELAIAMFAGDHVDSPAVARDRFSQLDSDTKERWLKRAETFRAFFDFGIGEHEES